MERTEQIEQYAQKLWEHRSYNFIEKVEKACGYPEGELNEEGSWGKGWDELPDKAKDHLRETAAQEVEAMSVPQSQIERYLTTMLRELDRLRPAASYGVAAHGLLWDKTWERLLLVLNVGDAVSLYPLRHGDLTIDPIATAMSLADKTALGVDDPDADFVMFKR
jgi:hypothetical protein